MVTLCNGRVVHGPASPRSAAVKQGVVLPRNGKVMYGPVVPRIAAASALENRRWVVKEKTLSRKKQP